jgi:hypothetical protein
MHDIDCFEQLAALESVGAFDLKLIKLLLGRTALVVKGRSTMGAGESPDARGRGTANLRRAE